MNVTDTKPKTKAQMAKAIEAKTDIRSQDVNEVLDALAEIVLEDLSASGPGSVTVAGLIKVDVVGQTARPERQGRNPATGETITIAARPALDRGKVRVRALKRLRDVL
jgi:DNA-binding protein HU-beta